MIKETNYLLGVSNALLTMVREHLIKKNDVDGVELIEDQYQRLMTAVGELQYPKEKSDAK
jgi:hypothetical protein